MKSSKLCYAKCKNSKNTLFFNWMKNCTSWSKFPRELGTAKGHETSTRRHVQTSRRRFFHTEVTLPQALLSSVLFWGTYKCWNWIKFSIFYKLVTTSRWKSNSLAFCFCLLKCNDPWWKFNMAEAKAYNEHGCACIMVLHFLILESCRC